ncbi:TonB-dependent vitamin B12 receptor [Marinobacterium sp. D7]|uniref:TonB-dependent vitamin B12 receptor n=1 Tax=Marinobacterium ramblicola TaxID=2849041 RepID=UPI001C2CCDFF|nr:TonB-dependent vitamin B12 receptor [Marinobacterium ramblicola]MBV1788456.1 TonB-dependent vitamin B12 receptor [Marinobacterium ramblicola]
MNRFTIPAAILLGSSAVSAVQAETLPTSIIVTASRSAETADETLAAVTVITRDDIERTQAQTVPELLGSAPGVMLVNSGGRGKASSLFLRGTNSDQVLVLIDGIKVGSATLGTTAFEQLAVDQIERIEIVRGPRSSLYGSEAIGGVIQIFTRRGGEGFSPRFSTGVGSNDSREVTLGASGGSDRGWYNLDLSDFSTQGFDAKTEGAFGHNPDDDGYNNRSWAVSGGYRFNDLAKGRFNWSRNEGINEYDGGSSFDDYETHQRLDTLGGVLELTPSDDWALSLTLGRSRDESTEYGDGAAQSHIDTERDIASVVSEHYLTDTVEFSWGVDYQQDEVDSSTDYAETSRDNIGVFGLYQHYFGAQDIAVSLRHDDNEQFGGKNTGSLAWGIQIDPDLRLFVSYGTAFKAPTFNDLYWPEDAFSVGNPDLLPEESESVEVGLSGEHADIRWSANLYQTEIENLISWEFDGKFTPKNVSDARIRGLELSAATRLAGWDLRSSLDLTDPKDLEDDSLLSRRPRKVLNLAADRDFGTWSLGGSLKAVGKRKDSSTHLAGYTTVDLRAGYRLGRDWSLKGRVDNLFDEQYQTVNNFNQPDREYWLSLHYTPGA